MGTFGEPIRCPSSTSNASSPEQVRELRGHVAHVGHVQERALLHAYVDERGLHARQDRAHYALVDVADDAAALPALDHDLDQLVVFENGDASLAARHVDNDFLMHITPLYGEPRPLVRVVQVLAIPQGHRCCAPYRLPSSIVALPDRFKSRPAAGGPARRAVRWIRASSGGAAPSGVSSLTTSTGRIAPS